MVLDRQAQILTDFNEVNTNIVQYIEKTDDLDMMFKRDYNEFVQARRRCKSDFDQATKTALQAVQDCEQMM